MNAPVTTSPYAGARWWITRHAVAQWAERFDMTATDDDAVRTLAEVSRGAWDTGTETPDGRAVWMHATTRARASWWRGRSAGRRARGGCRRSSRYCRSSSRRAGAAGG